MSFRPTTATALHSGLWQFSAVSKKFFVLSSNNLYSNGKGTIVAVVELKVGNPLTIYLSIP